MNLSKSLLFFGIPGLLSYLAIYYLLPIVTRQGLPLIVGWTVALWGPLVVLFIFELTSFLQNPNRPTFKERFRFHSLTKKEWGIVAAAFFLVQILEVFLSPTGAFLTQFRFFALPEIIPELFNPTFEIEKGLTYLLGVPVQGNWWLVLFWLGWLVINIGCEEILWRGHALPLQEKYFGHYAWLVNGLCWNLLFHYFMLWSFITIMPISLIIPYLAQKYKSTWIGVVIHGVGNLLVLVILIPGIVAK